MINLAIEFMDGGSLEDLVRQGYNNNNNNNNDKNSSNNNT